MLGFVGGLFGTIMALALSAAFVWLVGFLWFVFTLPTAPDDPARRSDAIVVLTGGPGRLGEGVALLKRDLAPVLYVSGAGAPKSDILKQAGELPPGLAERVVVDQRAANTRGNAKETAVWFNAGNRKSLRLVTAHHHMRRSLLEFRRHLPRAEILAHPVALPGFGPGEWWRRFESVNVVFWEFNKYLVAVVRPPID